ncbi:acetyltransferase [Chryseobacterium wangxinyae]|uniref:acetyltransferase n=1 Tax=Chryseobacterium sp. CY350 TaxID=2997336 RepID=UPI002270B3BD|nr:acetyltransferase [Chryseobacterium sp. CY350]MCY0979372.1 acetyltransferase [Chryseobacterium sp. CY350]WBZ97131.1 acetyltransferase [Chryseobacterium sp. CY350]
MLIIGAKGFAKEVLEIFHQKNQLSNLAFFDDVNHYGDSLLFNKFKILKDEDEVKEFFDLSDSNFTIGIGNPHLRFNIYKKFISLNGKCISVISDKAQIGSYDVKIAEGSTILDNVILSNSVIIGRCSLVYYNVTITHDCQVDDFVELSPAVTLLGGCHIGAFSQIGSGATILPKVKIGSNVIIGAGSVVNKDIPDNCVAVGVPARVIKKI